MGLLSRAAKKALDMSTEARMARAKKGGWTTKAYRAADASEPQMTWFSTKTEASNQYAEGDAVSYPVLLNTRGFRVVDAKRQPWENVGPDTLAREVREAGLPGLIIRNIDDGMTTPVIADSIYVNPDFASRVRSRFAAFDPAKRDSSDLLAALAGLGVAGLGGGLLSRGQRA